MVEQTETSVVHEREKRRKHKQFVDSLKDKERYPCQKNVENIHPRWKCPACQALFKTYEKFETHSTTCLKMRKGEFPPNATKRDRRKNK